MLNQIIKDSLGTQIHSILEPPGLSRTDFKRADVPTSLTPWIRGSSLVWDATVVDGLAPSRFHGGDLYAGKAATEAEDLKAKKCEPLVRDGYYFQAVAFETHGECGSDTLRFIRDLGRLLTDLVDFRDLCRNNSRIILLSMVGQFVRGRYYIFLCYIK